MILTNVYHKTIKALKGKRIIGNRGGTSSSKTYSNLQLLYTIAAESRKPLTISVISETLPHLKKGAMKDFFDILKSEGVYSEKKHNKTDNIYKVGNSVIEFFSADNSDKVHGPRRDISYINECNHISWSIIEQLEIRTKYWILLDWNPTDAFWFEKEFLPREDCDLI
jgi:phage terminase large subunit